MIIRSLSLPDDILLEARDHVGPTSIIRGEVTEQNLTLAASITLRYADVSKVY